jgi:hypothetical protein
MNKSKSSKQRKLRLKTKPKWAVVGASLLRNGLPFAVICNNKVWQSLPPAKLESLLRDLNRTPRRHRLEADI